MTSLKRTPSAARGPVVLCILDGWGWAPASDRNGITAAKTPHWDALLRQYPHTTLEASEEWVGLPPGQMGNSEVGHMTIGCGRAFPQDLPRLTQAFQEGTVAAEEPFQTFVKKMRASGGVAHVMGLLSPGGVHAHQDHFLESVKLLRGENIPVALHLFLDGRDTPPQSARGYVGEFLESLRQTYGETTAIQLASIGGRYYAMDRDFHWDRIQKAYTCLTKAEANTISMACPDAFFKSQYADGVYDEFIPPHRFPHASEMRDGDGLFLVNFRSDRARQILQALLQTDFLGFDRGQRIHFAATLGLGHYGADLAPLIPPLFSPAFPTRSLGACLAEAGLRQLRLAETEKYAHVTFFFNGGREDPFEGEDRRLVPSPGVATYNLCPEMAAQEVTEEALKSLKSGAHDVIIMNYANADMVGHTGDFKATLRAIETLDQCLRRLQEQVLGAGGSLLITADHGNAEQMWDPKTDGPHTAHTTNLVPFVYVSNAAARMAPQAALRAGGTLADIAPTVLTLLGLPPEKEMHGHSLLL